MSYSVGTTAHLTTLSNDANLTATHTCHDGASGVCRLLKRPHTKQALAGTPNFFGALNDGLYRLDISTREAGPDPTGTVHLTCNYDHSLVLLKNGADLALLQCWSRRYTMGEWLNAVGVNLVTTWCAAMYSPGSATTSTEGVKQWTQQIPRLQSAYNTRKWDEFDQIAKLMFAADKSNSQTNKIRAANQSVMEFRWTYWQI